MIRMTTRPPVMTAYFRARIDHHVNGMLARTQARLPQGVKSVQGDVTSPRIVVTMHDGTEFVYTKYFCGGTVFLA
jgi:hypothetical protein